MGADEEAVVKFLLAETTANSKSGKMIVSLENARIGARRAVEKARGGKVEKQTFPPRLEIPQNARDSHFPTASAAASH
jgi:hypothetical protein